MRLEIAVETLHAWPLPPVSSVGNQGVGIGETIHEAYLAAYLLTGCAELAESAVLNAVEAWRPERQSERELFMLALKAATVRGSTGPEPVANHLALPPELEAVLRLPRELREAYVLRFLTGVSREASAELLGISRAKLDEYASAALASLPLLSFQREE
jgi:hypothetical protein